MRRFEYLRAETVAQAVEALSGTADASALAGGTNLVDLMKYEVARPSLVVDINRLPLNDIVETDGGGLRIGALVPNSDLARDPRVVRHYPLLASAILAGASPQLRNAATTGGNLLQRTRCVYFYDTATPCNKRARGSGCPALEGANRQHAILGGSDSCIAVHPSDMCVALAVLDAVVHVVGPAGERRIAFSDFHRLPGDEPHLDNSLRHGELIVAVELPAPAIARHHTYLKVRDRLSYAFALVSVAVGLRLEARVIAEARVALGGVAHRPWRDRVAESRLTGQPADVASFRAFSEAMLAPARVREHNEFKVELSRRAIVRALAQAATGTPQSQSDKRVL